MADHYARVLDFVENLPAEGDAIAGYSRNGKTYKLTGADLRGLLAELKEAREQIRDRDYVNAQLRKSVEQYRAKLAEFGEVELKWGVRAGIRSTGRTEDIVQPSEESARGRVARSNGASVLICRTKAGEWHEADQEKD